MSRAALTALVVALLAAPACARSKEGPASASSQGAGGTADAAAEPGPVDAGSALPSPEPPPIEAGPAPDGADASVTREARERAVLDLLAGGEPATRLPRAVVDPGSRFDDALRDRVSPRLGPPSVRMGVVVVDGRLPPEVIQRIVRQNFGRFRLCYENALRTKPELSGKVVIHFVIQRDGAVGSATSRDSALPDPPTVECVRKAFLGMSFPTPEGGVVDVTFPILLAPRP
jgi:hypothetical protein